MVASTTNNGGGKSSQLRGLSSLRCYFQVCERHFLVLTSPRLSHQTRNLLPTVRLHKLAHRVSDSCARHAKKTLYRRTTSRRIERGLCMLDSVCKHTIRKRAQRREVSDTVFLSSFIHSWNLGRNCCVRTEEWQCEYLAHL